MDRTPHILLLADLVGEFDREMVEGVRRFSQTVAPLELTVDQPDAGASSLRGDWPLDGVIGRFKTPEAYLPFEQAGLPIVGVGSVARDSVTRVRVDAEAGVVLAFEHFMERGYTRLAFCGERAPHFSTARALQFAELAAERGVRCDRYEGMARRWWRTRWDRVLQHMVDWLKTLELPVGILCSNDDRAQHVLAACERARLSVPEQVAVLGTGNHELLCATSRPQLSSVDLNSTGLGYAAAECMIQCLREQKNVTQVRVVPPRGVVARHSTDTVGTGDRLVATAIAYIRDHVDQSIQVDDVVTATGVSRRNLEGRFTDVLGTTIRREIERRHVEHAKSLLLNTDLPAHRIAKLSGFHDARRLSVVFRSVTGQTPTDFRRQFSQARWRG